MKSKLSTSKLYFLYSAFRLALKLYIFLHILKLYKSIFTLFGSNIKLISFFYTNGTILFETEYTTLEIKVDKFGFVLNQLKEILNIISINFKERLGYLKGTIKRIKPHKIKK